MPHDDRTGLLFALAGFSLLSLGDAVVKSMAAEWPPTAISTLRYTIGAVGLCVLLWRAEGAGAFRMRRPGLQWLRGGAVAVSTMCFFSALMLMPLDEATTIVFVQPMITGLLAPLFLREERRIATWIASLAAFAGVVIVLRPNLAELGLAALLPLAAALGMSVLFMANRAVAGSASALRMQALLALTALPFLYLGTLAGHLSEIPALHLSLPSTDVVLRCALVAFTASSGHWLIYLGTTRAGASTIAPMTYVQLLVAGGLGWLWFADRPDPPTLIGAGIIIAAGLYLWRSGQRAPAIRTY